MNRTAAKSDRLELAFTGKFALTFGAVTMFINTLILTYTLWYRNYPPLKAKNIKLIVILYISMVIWYLGTIGTNFNQYGYFDFGSSCVLFGLWFRILGGVILFIAVHLLRLYIYIRIFIKRQRVDYRLYLKSGAIYVVVICGYGIPLSILRHQLSVEFIKEIGTCRYGKVFQELSFAIVWIGWAAILILTFLARKINTSFKEYREMLLIVFLASVAILYQTIVHHIVRDYIAHRWSRVTSTFAEYCASQTSLLILLSVPIYNCMFHREEYKKRFYDKMIADGMASRYGLTLPSSGSIEPSA